jgi:hypothetical protein
LSDLISRAEKSSTQSGDGNTIETVECLEAKTAQWDNRMTVAYQQPLGLASWKRSVIGDISGSMARLRAAALLASR